MGWKTERIEALCKEHGVYYAKHASKWKFSKYPDKCYHALSQSIPIHKTVSEALAFIEGYHFAIRGY